MKVIGIDPGSAGGMACLYDVGPDVCKLDGTERDTSDALKFWAAAYQCFAYLERVWASRGSGDRTMGAATMFTFGQNYGFIRGLLIAHGIPFEEVLPAKWQAEFGLKRTDKSESDTQKKNRHKAKAQQLFPGVKVTLWNCDALLIAEYGRRVRSHQQVKETA